MKKLLIVALLLLTAVGANAQFEKKKVYIGASLTGLNIQYNGSREMSVGLQAQAGYMVDTDFLLFGTVDYDNPGKDIDATLGLGFGGRYYIEQNGIFLGANVKYYHSDAYDDFMPGVECGYAFFLSKTVTVEPALYYQQSFKSHKDYSTIGLKVGVGIYLFKK